MPPLAEIMAILYRFACIAKGAMSLGTQGAARSVNASRQEAQRAEKISSLTPEAKTAAKEATWILRIKLFPSCNVDAAVW